MTHPTQSDYARILAERDRYRDALESVVAINSALPRRQQIEQAPHTVSLMRHKAREALNSEGGGGS